MEAYIYKIVNKITNEKYIGQTINFSRRISEHLNKLKNNSHPNKKLQNSWNKYGEDNFYIDKTKYSCSKEELNRLEIETILREDSYNHGFNLTLGGDGGNTRGKLTFEQYCFIYFGNKKYKGLLNRTAKYLKIDSSTASAIVREKSYNFYHDKAISLSPEEKEEYIKFFEQALKIKECPPTQNKQKLTQEQFNQFFSVVSVYGRGAEACVTRYFNISKGLKNHVVHGEYQQEKENFLLLSKEEIENIAVKLFEEENLQQYCAQKVKKNKEIIFPF